MSVSSDKISRTFDVNVKPLKTSRKRFQKKKLFGEKFNQAFHLAISFVTKEFFWGGGGGGRAEVGGMYPMPNRVKKIQLSPLALAAIVNVYNNNIF